MFIGDYEFGRIIINGKAYTNDVIIVGDTVHANWWRKSGHELHMDDLSEITEAEPDVLVVGTGYHGRMRVLESTKKGLEHIGCELVVQKTNEAVETYNEHESKRKVAAALHLSC